MKTLSHKPASKRESILTQIQKLMVGQTGERESDAVVGLCVLFASLICEQCSFPLNPTHCEGIQRVGVCGSVYTLCSNLAFNLKNKEYHRAKRSQRKALLSLM